jgi:hypothetical protein
MDSITFKCYGKNRTPILGLFSWQNLVLATCFFLRAGVASAWPAAMSTPGRPKRTRKQVERYVPAVVPEAAQDWFRRDPDSHFLPGSGSDNSYLPHLWGYAPHWWAETLVMMCGAIGIPSIVPWVARSLSRNTISGAPLTPRAQCCRNRGRAIGRPGRHNAHLP